MTTSPGAVGVPGPDVSSPSDREVYLAVDIGGTFTDIVVIGSDGSLHTEKVLSTFDDLLHGIEVGLRDVLADGGITGEEVVKVVHASTVGTNTVLEYRGAVTGLITTRGFRDVLEIGRLRRPTMYDVFWDKPPPLVRRQLRAEVTERVRSDGSVAEPLVREELGPILDDFDQLGVESIAVSLLHAYANPEHERTIGEAIRERLPSAHVSLSHEVLPEIREFERTSTTVINAYVTPAIATYLDRLDEVLQRIGICAPLFMMQSSGGAIPETAARRLACTILQSGPAAGVLATSFMAKAIGLENAIAFDMGGTTAKASVIQAGTPEMAFEYEVGAGMNAASPLLKGGGYALRGSTIGIAEVGSGGGSIASVDAGGALQVGPESASANPGPACYGLGGTLPTVTDANVVLGYLSPKTIAGGRLRIDAGRAIAAVEEHICAKLAIGLEEAAWGIHLIANENMARAVRAVTVERGRDPERFDLVAFGGSGPVHAAGLAQAIGIKRVIVPVAAGLFSAFGLLFADIRRDSVATLTRVVGDDLDEDDLRHELLGLGEGALDEMTQLTGIQHDSFALQYLLDVRYVGQSAEVTIELDLHSDLRRRITELFTEEYARLYGRPGTGEIEIVNIRSALSAPIRRTEYGTVAATVIDRGEAATRARRLAYFGPQTGFLEAVIYDGRRSLGRGRVAGPAVIQEVDATILVPPGCEAALDHTANVIIHVA